FARGDHGNRWVCGQGSGMPGSGSDPLRDGKNRSEDGAADFKSFLEGQPMTNAGGVLAAHPLLQMRVRTEKGDCRAARRCCCLGVGEIIPDYGFGRAEVRHGRSVLINKDLDRIPTAPAGRRYSCVRMQHAGDAKRVDSANGVKLPAEKLDTVLGWTGGKWVGISDCSARCVEGEEIARLEFAEDHVDFVTGHAGRVGTPRNRGGTAVRCE